MDQRMPPTGGFRRVLRAYGGFLPQAHAALAFTRADLQACRSSGMGRSRGSTATLPLASIRFDATRRAGQELQTESCFDRIYRIHKDGTASGFPHRDSCA